MNIYNLLVIIVLNYLILLNIFQLKIRHHYKDNN